MEEVLHYLVKVSAGTAAFYLFYLLLFSKRKQFRFNRVYLLGSFLLSLLIPMVTITITRQATAQFVLLPAATETLNPVEASAGGAISLNVILLLLYGTGVLLFLVNLIMGHLRVWQISRESRPGTSGGIGYFVTPEDVHPFTFFRRIVVPEESILQPYLPMILRHEKIHAGNHHTMDILVSEILFLIQWFNPFAWLMKNAIKNNLEYLTDEEVTRVADPHAYQLALVALAGKKGMAPFLNALNGNDLKTRIIMMKQKTENRNSVIRKLMVVPLTALLITGLSAREYKTLPPLESNGTLSAEQLAEFSGMPAGTRQSATTPHQGDLQPQFAPALPGAAESGMLSGDTVVKASDVTVITGFPVGNGQESFRIEADEMVVTNLGHGAGQVIRLKTYEVDPEGRNIVRDTVRIRTTGGKDGPQPLYILDGKPVPSIENINPEDIESISVLKNESSVAIYGEKGKNGVILITTKKGSSEKNETQPSTEGKKVYEAHFQKFTDSKDPLIIIDGKESTKKVTDIDPDGIQSVTVLKGESAVGKFGEKGKHGVIEITMKTFLSSDEKAPSSKEASHPAQVRIIGYSDGTDGSITSVEQLRKSIARSVKYPVKAQETGFQSVETVYGYVSEGGKIIRITDMKPEGEIIPVDEVVIVAYGATNQQAAVKKAKTDDKSSLLLDEALLQVRNLPDIDIPEWRGRWLKFQFNFVLQ